MHSYIEVIIHGLETVLLGELPLFHVATSDRILGVFQVCSTIVSRFAHEHGLCHDPLVASWKAPKGIDIRMFHVGSNL